MDEPSPEGPFFLLAGPSSHHALQNALKALLPFKIPKQSFKGRIVRKQMQSFGDGQSVTGSDQDSVRFSEFFRNRVPINHIRSALSILCLLRWIAPAGGQLKFPSNLLANTGCVPADALAYEMPLD